MNSQESEPQEHGQEALGAGWTHMVWALSLSVLMFGLGFLAGSRWAEQRASENERVVVGRPVPPQVEISPQEQEMSPDEAQEARLWKILTGKENPSAVLPPLSATKDSRDSTAQPKPPRSPGGSPPARPLQETQLPATAQPSRPAGQAVSQPPGAPQATGSRFALQVVSVQSREKAEAIVRELNGKGYPLVRIAQAEVPGKGTWYRIWVGSFEKKEEAETLRRQVLERERLQAQVVLERR